MRNEAQVVQVNIRRQRQTPLQKIHQTCHQIVFPSKVSLTLFSSTHVPKKKKITPDHSPNNLFDTCHGGNAWSTSQAPKSRAHSTRHLAGLLHNGAQLERRERARPIHQADF